MYGVPLGVVCVWQNMQAHHTERHGSRTDCALCFPLITDPIFKGNKVPNPEMGYPGGIFDPFGELQDCS